MIYLFSLTLVIATGVNLSIPLVPLYLRDLGANVFQISIVMSVAGLPATLLTYLGGFLSDRYGRKLSFILAILLSAFPPIMYTFSKTWIEMIPWVILFNTSLAFFGPARVAYIADTFNVRELGKIYGLMNIAWPLGGMIGPFLGGYLTDMWGWNASFYFVGLISAISTIPAYLLQESSRTRVGDIEDELPCEDGSNLSTLPIFFAIAVLISTGIDATRPLLPLYLSSIFQLSKTDIGLFFTLSFGVTTLITQISTSVVLKRYGSKRAMLHSVLLIPVAFILLPWIKSYNLLILDYMVVNSLWSVTWPASMDLLMRCVPRERRGSAAGIRQTGIRLGGVFGPLVGAYLWEVFGISFSFYYSAVAFALCVPLIILIREPEIGTSPQSTL
jgi:DHA1 family quinolone resistance protein-like MFS transporter